MELERELDELKNEDAEKETKVKKGKETQPEPEAVAEKVTQPQATELPPRAGEGGAFVQFL